LGLRFVCSLRFQDLPNDAVEKCKRIILHEVGCTFGGAKTIAGDALIKTIKFTGDSYIPTIFGDSK